ncbi:hypothetical protein PUR56_00645, partial [Streptomyces sp. BE303]
RSLRTLPREQERHPTRTRNTRQTTRPGSYRAQPGRQPLGVTGEHHRQDLPTGSPLHRGQ